MNAHRIRSESFDLKTNRHGATVPVASWLQTGPLLSPNCAAVGSPAPASSLPRRAATARHHSPTLGEKKTGVGGDAGGLGWCRLGAACGEMRSPAPNYRTHGSSPSGSKSRRRNVPPSPTDSKSPHHGSPNRVAVGSPAPASSLPQPTGDGASGDCRAVGCGRWIPGGQPQSLLRLPGARGWWGLRRATVARA